MDQEVLELISTDAFHRNYSKILTELDNLHRGVFDDSDAENWAALCLLAQAALNKELAIAEHRARALKRDIELAKAKAYSALREKKEEGKKITETALAFFLNMDTKVNEIISEQNEAERSAKEFATIMNILKDAHLLFRAKSKK